MIERYVFDACALIAYINDEDGADSVEKCINLAAEGKAVISMGKVNLLEVYYGVFRDFGASKAAEVLEEILLLPLQIVNDLGDKMFTEAGRLKATYRISLADALALSLASISGDILVTSDHHEFDIIEAKENIKFSWIR